MNTLERVAVTRSWLDSRSMGQRAVLAVSFVCFVIWLILVTMSTMYGGGNLFLNMWYAFLLVGVPTGLIMGGVLLGVWVSRGKTKS